MAPKPTSPDAVRSLRGKIGGHKKWALTEDRTAATSAARAAFEQRFLDEADGDPQRAEHLRKAYYAGLALKSVQARRKIKTLTSEAEAAEAELQRAGATPQDAA